MIISVVNGKGAARSTNVTSLSTFIYFVWSGEQMEVEKFYIQKRYLHKYVRFMYELLEDGRFYQLDRAKKIVLPSKYGPNSGPIESFERIYHCADGYKAIVDEKSGKHCITKIKFCNDRICPVCTVRKTLKEYGRLSWKIEKLKDDYTFYFLTLTLPNNYDGFGFELKLIKSVLQDLLDFVGYDHRSARFRFCKGVFGSYEIVKKDKGWHPHLHLVLAYPKNYVESTKTARKIIRGRERIFENGLQLRCGKKSLLLSQDTIMQKYIELVKSKTDVYNERLEDLNFLNIGFQPCYNIEEGVNELTKYLTKFENIETADDLFVYMRDSFNLAQRVKRGIFKWTSDDKREFREYILALKEKQNFDFIQSESSYSYTFEYYKGQYYGTRYIHKDVPIPYTNRTQSVYFAKCIKIVPIYDKERRFLHYEITHYPLRLCKNFHYKETVVFADIGILQCKFFE